MYLVAAADHQRGGGGVSGERSGLSYRIGGKTLSPLGLTKTCGRKPK